MTEYHRGRRRSHRDYDYDDYGYAEPSHSEHYYETRPRRHRSLGRQALDKLGDAMAGLGINDDSRDNDYHHHHHHRDRDHHHHTASSSHHHSRHHSPHHHSNRSRSTQRRHHRRAHSSSPTRHYSHRDEPVRSSRARARTRTRTRTRSRSRPAAARSRSRVDRGIKAAMEAGAIEAFRVRKEPGGWAGAKGSRVATAAVSAGLIGAAAEKRKQDKDGDTRLGTKGSALAGMVVNRLINGPRRELEG